MTWAYVLRDRQILKVSIPLSIEDKLVPPHVWDTSPKYFVYGGLVFTALTKKFVKGKMGTSDGTPVFLLNYVEQGRFQEEEDDEIVLLSSILASDVTIGYEAAPSVVVSVQGEKVQNLSQLAFLIETSKDPFITFVLEIQGSRNLPLILDRKDAKRVTKDILEKHRIRSDRSLHYKLLHSPFSS
ncbi:trypsin domain-containing protein [Cystoisospora suis]|uniref:Trypsin domain-containing protein n=1 Tax=Cystoisospora suis TaxID=483139 RepID=A0A2C6KPR6_9APIC|nr:trypsin domain-containing protein [Cystoisospora suis]